MRFMHMIIAVFLCFMNAAFAIQPDSVITLSTNFSANCQDYTGIWQGFITDPSGLFHEGGPWEITIKLYDDNTHVMGSTSEIKMGKANKITGRQLWAECQHGGLKNIFWGDRGSCGSPSQQGVLISKNVLIMQLSYENAMTGTSFYTFLKRKSSTYPDAIPANPQSFVPGDIKSCH